MNTDVLGEVISFLDIAGDRHVLASYKQLFKLSDKENNQIIRTWENNSKYECVKDEEKTVWRVNGKLHRDNDLPAIEYTRGRKEWFVNGVRHRDNDLPAIEYPDGSKEWWVNGKRHRENDRPAIEYVRGSKEWWVNGKRHREANKPAVEWLRGSKEWWIHGKFIRPIGLIRKTYWLD